MNEKFLFQSEDFNIETIRKIRLWIEELQDNKKDSDTLLIELQKLVRRNIEKEEFTDLLEKLEKEEFAIPLIDKIAYDLIILRVTIDKSISESEILELIRKILNFECPDDLHEYYWLRILEVNIPCINISNLIYDPNNEDLSAEEIYKKAKKYKPIQL